MASSLLLNNDLVRGIYYQLGLIIAGGKVKIRLIIRDSEGLEYPSAPFVFQKARKTVIAPNPANTAINSIMMKSRYMESFWKQTYAITMPGYNKNIILPVSCGSMGQNHVESHWQSMNGTVARALKITQMSINERDTFMDDNFRRS